MIYEYQVNNNKKIIIQSYNKHLKLTNLFLNI